MAGADHHHCPICGGFKGSRCVTKGHLLECAVHPGVYYRPGWYCVMCHEKKERAAKAEADLKRKEADAKRAEEAAKKAEEAKNKKNKHNSKGNAKGKGQK